MVGARRSKATPSSILIHSLRRKLGAECDPERQRRGMAGRKGEDEPVAPVPAVPLALLGHRPGRSSRQAFSPFPTRSGEAIELQDDQLRQTAALLQHQRFSTPPIEVAGPPDADPESRLIVLTAAAGGSLAARGRCAGLRADAPDGLQTVAIRGVPWRFVISTDDRGLRIAIGQQTAVRDEIANKSALRTVAPLLSLILLLPLMIGVTIRSMLRPLKSIAADLEFRSESDWS